MAISADNGVEYGIYSGLGSTGAAITAGSVQNAGYNQVGPYLGQYGGVVREVPMSYIVSSASYASSGTLTMGKIPKGMVPAYARIYSSVDQGATATFAVGITGTTGLYLTALVLHTAVNGTASFYSTATGPYCVFGDTTTTAGGALTWDHARLSADQTILITWASAAPSAGVIYLVMGGYMDT